MNHGMSLWVPFVLVAGVMLGYWLARKTGRIEYDAGYEDGLVDGQDRVLLASDTLGPERGSVVVDFELARELARR